MDIKRYLTSMMLVLIRDKRKKADFIRKYKLIHHMGEKCRYQPNKLPSELFLLSIHNNVSVATNLTSCTHDIICDVFDGNEIYPGSRRQAFYMGKIKVYDNVVIGVNSLIMYNTKIGPNAIIAAGSVVTHDIPEGAIVGATRQGYWECLGSAKKA
ncbi:hypothetical protein [uncultured Faecalicoccus sp.]|uniref:acyltransferase n=1 Tax=uncultured Faecalicoccus sp. TaxID=1971760 RepID=UPI00258AAC39|nr:hypothetical protein [uncultured Faecalicoccus sp.]